MTSFIVSKYFKTFIITVLLYTDLQLFSQSLNSIYCLLTENQRMIEKRFAMTSQNI